jgi:hypothetical protein
MASSICQCHAIICRSGQSGVGGPGANVLILNIDQHTLGKNSITFLERRTQPDFLRPLLMAAISEARINK